MNVDFDEAVGDERVRNEVAFEDVRAAEREVEVDLSEGSERRSLLSSRIAW